MARKIFSALFSTNVLRVRDNAVAKELHVALENAGEDRLVRIVR